MAFYLRKRLGGCRSNQVHCPADSYLFGTTQRPSLFLLTSLRHSPQHIFVTSRRIATSAKKHHLLGSGQFSSHSGLGLWERSITPHIEQLYSLRRSHSSPSRSVAIANPSSMRHSTDGESHSVAMVPQLPNAATSAAISEAKSAATIVAMLIINAPATTMTIPVATMMAAPASGSSFGIVL